MYGNSTPLHSHLCSAQGQRARDKDRQNDRASSLSSRITSSVLSSIFLKDKRVCVGKREGERMLEFLMTQNQVDVNVKERRGWNLLHLAAGHCVCFVRESV